MKGKLELNISPEDIQYEVKGLIKELCSGEIKSIVRKTAENLVVDEVNKILEPLVVKVLTEEKLSFKDYNGTYKNPAILDDKIKQFVRNYLDQPCYLYSKSSIKPSDRYTRSSSKNDRSRIEHYLNHSIKRYFDENIKKAADGLVNDLINNKEKLESFIKDQIKEYSDKQQKLLKTLKDSGEFTDKGSDN